MPFSTSAAPRSNNGSLSLGDADLDADRPATPISTGCSRPNTFSHDAAISCGSIQPGAGGESHDRGAGDRQADAETPDSSVSAALLLLPPLSGRHRTACRNSGYSEGRQAAMTAVLASSTHQMCSWLEIPGENGEF